LEDVTATTYAIAEDIEALMRGMYELLLAGEYMYPTPPPSTMHSPRMGKDDIKLPNGLPVSPVSTTADPYPTAIETPLMQDLGMNDLLSAMEHIQHSASAPLAINLQITLQIVSPTTINLVLGFLYHHIVRRGWMR
jgi:hypothetical protein